MVERYKQFCCAKGCLNNLQCASGLDDRALIGEGWKQTKGRWYCDECAPYEQKDTNNG